MHSTTELAIATILIIFTSLGYTIEYPDEIAYNGIEYDGWINYHTKTVWFSPDALNENNKDAFGYTIPYHELAHAICECNWH